MEDHLVFAGRVIWCLFIVIWGAIRWRPNVKSRRHAIKVTQRSLKERLCLAISFSGLGLIPGVWVFSDFPDGLNFRPGLATLTVGGLLLVAALAMFRATHKALGHMWSNSLDLRQGHQLITTSVYSRLRHPMYTAFWLWALGQSLVLGNWLAALSGLVGFGFLFFVRVGDEERMMEQEFGEQYRKYSQRTKRIIPGVY